MSRGSTPRHAQTAGDLDFAVQFNAETLWHFSGRIVPRVTIGIVMVIGKEKCYDFYGRPTSISGHNIIGLIAVWYIDITEDIVAFVLAKITSCAKRVQCFV